MPSEIEIRVRVGLSWAWYVVFASVGAVAGGVLGLLLDPILAWANGQDWLPAGGLIRVLENAAAASPTWLQVTVSAVLGAFAGLLLAQQSNAVEVSGDELVLVEGATRHRVARSQVDHTVVEGRRLSVRDQSDVDLVTTVVDADANRLRAVLVEHGWSVRG